MVTESDDRSPFFFDLLYWVCISSLLHSVFLILGYGISFLPEVLPSYWVVDLLIYLYAISVPLFVFYILVFAGEKIERTTAIALVFCFVVMVPIFYAVFYFSSHCLSQGANDLSNGLYFSFLTFSTLGYGDSGLAEHCKPFAVGQSVYGLLAVAGLVALVSKPSNQS